MGTQISHNLNISILLYADDIVLLAENEVNLQLMLSTLEKWCRDWKLDVNLNVLALRSCQLESLNVPNGESQSTLTGYYKRNISTK